MNINIGPETVEDLYNAGYVKDSADLYNVDGCRFIASGTVGGEERPESDVESGGIQASSF